MRISDWSSDVCSSDLHCAASSRTRFCPHGHSRLSIMEGPVAQVEDNDGSLEIGRASCRERVCQYVEISVVAVSLKKNNKYNMYSIDLIIERTLTIVTHIDLEYSTLHNDEMNKF